MAIKNKNFPDFLKLMDDMQKSKLNHSTVVDLPLKNQWVPQLSVDVSTIMDTHRKNTQALATVQQMTMDGIHILTRCMGDMISDMVAVQTDYVRSFAVPDLTGEKMADRAVILQKIVDRVSAHYDEISDIAHRSRRETGHVVRARLSASLGDIKVAADRARARRTR